MEYMASQICPPDADGQARRVAMRFALCAYSANLASAGHILPDDFDSNSYAGHCFNLWLDKRGGAGNLESAAILSQVRLFIEQHGQSRFQDWDTPNSVVVNRVGYRKDGKFYCFPESFKAEIIKGYSVKQAIKALGAAGWLERQSGAWQVVISIPEGKQRRMYVINWPNEKNE